MGHFTTVYANRQGPGGLFSFGRGQPEPTDVLVTQTSVLQ